MSSTSFSEKVSLLSAAEDQAEKVLIRPDPDLDHAIANSKKNNIPEITVRAIQGQFLAIQAQLIGAKSVLEIGTLGGYSTIWLAKTGAAVTSIEINPKHRDVANENLKAAGLSADTILGAALDVLPKLSAEGRQFDFVFIDADWGEQWEYFDWAVKLTRKNGLIYIDNVVQEIISNGNGVSEQSLVARVGADTRVTASLVPTISAYKSRNDLACIDGFLLIIVK